MNSKTPFLAAMALAAAVYGGTATAGHYVHGYPSHGRSHGYVSHHAFGHGPARYYGHRRINYRPPVRVIRYSRYEVHRHGPYCGHAGYRGYSRFDRFWSPRPRYYRDYGYASFRGYSDGVGYRLNFGY